MQAVNQTYFLQAKGLRAAMINSSRNCNCRQSSRLERINYLRYKLVYHKKNKMLHITIIHTATDIFLCIGVNVFHIFMNYTQLEQINVVKAS